MPNEARTPIPVGSSVYLLAFGEKILGTKFMEGIFKADFHDPRLHNGGGRGSNGYYWYVSDSHMEFSKPPERKKTGFAKFIGKIENV